MGEGRLSSLALMNIKYEMPVNLEGVENLFEAFHHRMMRIASLAYEQILELDRQERASILRIMLS